MNKQTFGSLVAATVAQLLATSALTAAPAAKAKAEKPAAAAGKCVHNCAGYASCKGNGNNSCKGHNECANQGLVPTECSSQTKEDACKKVADAKKNTMCSWYPG